MEVINLTIISGNGTIHKNNLVTTAHLIHSIRSLVIALHINPVPPSLVNVYEVPVSIDDIVALQPQKSLPLTIVPKRNIEI